MSDNDHIIEHEEVPQKPAGRHEFNAKKRLRRIAILCVLVVVMYGVMKFTTPSPYKPIMDAPEIQQTAPTPPADQPANPSPSTAETENATTAPADPVVESPNDAATLPVVNEPVVDAPATVENAETVETPVETGALQTEPQSLENQAPEAASPETVAALPSEDVALPAAEPTNTAPVVDNGKDKKILELQCLVQLQTQQIEQIKQALSNCYAVMVNAGVSARDIYVLKRAAQEDFLVNDATLKQSFKDAIQKSLLAAKAKNNNLGWYMTAKQHISSLVTIRKTGWQEGPDVEAIIARAEVYLDQGKVRAALNEIQTLPETSEKAFATFVEQCHTLISLKRVKSILKGDEANAWDGEDSYAH